MIDQMQTVFQQRKHMSAIDRLKQEEQKIEKIVQEGGQVLSEVKQVLKERSKINIDRQQEKQKFEILAHEAPKPILTLHAIFPLDFFPDTVIVDSAKVTQIHRIFFRTEQIKSIMIKDIKYSIAECGPFFSTLRLADNMLQPTTLVIKPLWRKDALEARNIIQGLMVSAKQEVDVTKIEPEKEIPRIQHLGEPAEKV